MLPHALRTCLVAAFLTTASGLDINYSRDFPLGSEVENLALRPNGAAIVVVNTFPQVYEVAPVPGSTPRLVHNFSNAVGTSSITASSNPDEFFVISGNFSFQTLSPTPDSYAIHRLVLDAAGNATVTELAPLDAIEQPNGMINVPGTPLVLIADTRGGFVYRFNTETQELDTYFDHPLLKPQPVQGVVFGVNGIKLARGYLYFSNTNRQFVARVRASGTEARLCGTPEIVANQTTVDDFAVDETNGDLYICQQEINGLGYLSGGAYGSTPTTIIGGGNSTALLGPSAAVWAKGAEGRTLLLSVTGGFEQFATQNYTGGGTVAIVNLD